MNDELLVSYLNDHLAGSVVAVEMIEYLGKNHADAELKSFLDRILAEIQEDRDVLKRMIERLGGSQNVAKKAAGWLAEKAGRIKVATDAASEVALARLEQLEVVFLGVTGKLALWEALDAARGNDPRFAEFDWAELKRRAEDQRTRIDRRRIEAAVEAFASAR